MSEPIWQQTVKASWMTFLVVSFAAEVVLFAALAIFVMAGMWVVVVLLVALGVGLVACFAVVDIAIDGDGIHVRYGSFGWPKFDVPPDEIESAEVADIRPMKWGGWGYRGSLKMIKRAGVIQRAGPGIHVNLTQGRMLAMTIDDPEGAVAALERVRTGR